MKPLLLAACLATLPLAACQRAGEDATPRPAASVPSPATAPAPAPAAPVTPGVAKATPSLQVTTLDGARYDLAAHRGK